MQKHYWRLISWKAAYFWSISELGSLLSKILCPIINPVCSWAENRWCIMVRDPGLGKEATQLLIENGGKPSKGGPVPLFSLIQSWTWSLGWSYGFRFMKQHVSDLIAAGRISDARNCLNDFPRGHKWAEAKLRGLEGR